jgi:hypothetical protein
MGRPIRTPPRRPAARRPMLVRIARNALLLRSQVSSERFNSRTTRRVGRCEIDVIKRYLDESGISGTVGKAANWPQGLAGLAEAAAKAGLPKLRPTINRQVRLRGAYAIVTSLPDSIYEDNIQLKDLSYEWEKILYDWEQTLLVDEYDVYRCVDKGEYTSAGAFYLTVGISTDKFHLEKFRAAISASDFEISFWKKIRGKVPWPKPRDGAPRGPREMTWKQG